VADIKNISEKAIDFIVLKWYSEFNKSRGGSNNEK
jgi:hypothetical protein